MPKISQKCKGYEVFQRLNYLYQIKDVMCKSATLSSHYGNLITSIAKKSVLKIEPSLKRQICRRCKAALVPEDTLAVKIKKVGDRKVMRHKCLHCKYVKEYPLCGKKTVWTEKKEALVGAIDCENMATSESNDKQSDKNKNGNGKKSKVKIYKSSSDEMKEKIVEEMSTG